MKLTSVLLLPLCILFCMQSCYYRQYTDATQDISEEKLDSMGFSRGHHYTVGFNFVVGVDSLELCTEIPSRAQQLTVMPDSIVVYDGDELIVAQIEVVPEDALDSVWVKVARDQLTQGWIRESQLLSSVVPDDPISLAIFFFSNNHVWITCLLAFLSALMLLYRLVRFRRFFDGAPMVTVCSPFPLLLCLCMAGSAVFYSSMQLFAPQAWSDFYFHPTLNPFAVPPLLGAFLFSFWLLVLFFIAAVDDAIRQMRFSQVVAFVFSLITWMAVLYMFFSLTTLVYWGYPLYVLFAVFSIWMYFKHVRPLFSCGHCGRPLHRKGVCPYCGTQNS